MSYSCISIVKRIEIRWSIKGLPNYGFGDDKKLYNTLRGTPVKRTLKNGCIGYWLNRRFYSESKLRPLLERPKYFNVPF